MFSKEYFKYLFRSKKYLLLIVFLVTLLNVIGNKNMDFALVIETIICGILSYVLPVNIFYHVHDKKAVDTYFSLPVSRKTQMCTGLVFCALWVFMPYLLAFMAFCMQKGPGIIALGYLALSVLVIIALVTFNTAVYLIGNNVIDGIIMMGAYTFMPFALYIVVDTMAYSFVAGYNIDTTIISYLSPAALGIKLVTMITEGPMIGIGDIMAMIVLPVISLFIINKEYVERKAERAGTISDAFFSYPFVIYFYVFMVLFIISSLNNYNYHGLGTFLSDHFVLYLLLFTIFIAAHMVYHRKLYFSYKLVLAYILAFAISLGFIGVCRATKGFGLSGLYPRDDLYGVYEVYYSTDVGWIDNETDKALMDKLGELVEERSDYYSIYVQGGDREKEVRITEESLELFEEMRRQGIDEFYDQKNDVFPRTSILIMSSANRNESYSYNCSRILTYEELCRLARDPNVNITISTYDTDYRLNRNGSLTIIARTYKYSDQTAADSEYIDE